MCPFKVQGVSNAVFDCKTLQKSALIVLRLTILFFDIFHFTALYKAKVSPDWPTLA